MNYTVRPILWTYKKNKKEIYPIKIMVTVNRKPVPVHTSHKIRVNQWDQALSRVTNHPNAKSINADLNRLVAEKELELMTAARMGERIDKDFIKGKKSDNTLIGFATEIGKKVTTKTGEKKLNINDQKEINRIIEYKGRSALLADVDAKWLRKYNEHEEARGMGQNTRNTTFRFLRRVINIAASEKLIRENPFDTWTLPQYIQPDTVYLVEEEKAGLFKLFNSLDTGPLYNTLCYSLFACYAGPRHSDWRKFHDNEMVYDGFLRLRPQKRSKGFVVMPVGPTLAELLERIKALNEPPYSLQKCNLHIKALFAMAQPTMKGRKYVGIKKDGSTHTMRHSFGYQCASLGLPKSTTAELMGISVQTVEVYYHLTGENIIKQAAALKNV